MRSRVLSLSAVLACALPAWSQTPYLVTDLDPAVASGAVGAPHAMTVAGPDLYTLAETPTGHALVKIDGAGSPHLVRQIPDSSAPATNAMAASGARVFFTSQGGLWTSGGTAAGTTMLRQFRAMGVVGGAAIAITAVDGIAYFPGGTTLADAGLWKSNGTVAGTVRVAPLPSAIRYFTPAGDRVFFVDYGQRLWTTDGTEAGTVRLGTFTVRDFASTVIALGDDVLVADGAGNLWRSDGTEAGTVMVKSFAPSFTHSLTRLGSDVLFAAGTPQGIWKTDGTEAGTVLVRPNISIRSMYGANGMVFVHGETPETGRELWKSDGTPAGTQVIDYCPGPCSFLFATNTSYAALPDGLMFSRTGSGELWRTDGTAAGTIQVRAFFNGADPPDAADMIPFAGSVYFSATSLAVSPPVKELWKSDGTPAGTVKLAMGIDGASSSPAFVGTVHDQAVFSATRADVGREVWITGGTAGSTSLLSDLTPGPQGSQWNAVASLGNRFTFGKTDNLVGVGSLWSTDGTAAGTRLIRQGIPDHTRAASHGGVALFGDTDGQFPGAGLFRTDGTPEGTRRVANPVTTEYVGLARAPGAIAEYADGFAVAMNDALGSRLSEVWLTKDGLAPPQAFTIPPQCDWLTPVDERLFLACHAPDAQIPNELWVSDATHSGTHLVAGLPAAALPGWVALGGRLYFRVGDASGWSLWSSDGTFSGTGLLSSNQALPVNSQALTVSNGLLYFAGFTFATGLELWRTDGTAAGTFLVRDIDPGPASGLDLDFESAARIVAVGGGVMFAAATGVSGSELWWSDGSTSGTLPLDEIVRGPVSSSPGALRRVGSRVYFAADDGGRGREPWAIDFGASALSVGDVTVDEGDAGTRTASFVVRLEPPATTPVSVSYATVPITAQAGVDFVPTAGTLTFAPGTSAMSVDVAVVGDVADESHESFVLQLTPAPGLTIDRGRAMGLILDDDLPTVTIAGASETEGDSGVVNLSFPVTLTTGGGPSAHAVVVRGETLLGTAGLEDFPPYTGGVMPTLSFPAGTPSGTTVPLLIPIAGDTKDEPNENFQVRLDGQNDASVTSPATGLIVDDDGVLAAPPVEIAHGTNIRADLVPVVSGQDGLDFYVIRQHLYSSYELVVDEVSGDAAPLLVERVGANGTVLQTAQAVGAGSALSLRWFATDDATEHIRVRGACGAACGPDDVYRLRVYDTSLAGTRVNNADSNTTVLILHNTTSVPVGGLLVRWNADGSLSPDFGATPYLIESHGSVVLPTDFHEGALFKGSLTVNTNAPYGALVGKLVTFDPSTGLTFETPLVARRR